MAASGLAHKPATYNLLPTYRVVDATTQQWDVTNAGVASAPHVRFQEHHNGIEVHPSGDRLVVVGWKSPVSGKVIIQGEFNREDTPQGGDGVDWRVENGSATLASGSLVAGEVVRFREDLGLSATVAVGDVLYFIVGPGPNGNFAFDSTRITVTIIQR